MARQLRIPQGRRENDGHDVGEVAIVFNLAAVKASKTFAKLKKHAPAYADEEILDIILGHIAEGVQ